MSEELKPCPFCGGSKVFVNCTEYVKCTCGASNGSDADWNTRPIEDALRAENEALQKAIAVLKQTFDAVHAERDGMAEENRMLSERIKQAIAKSTRTCAGYSHICENECPLFEWCPKAKEAK